MKQLGKILLIGLICLFLIGVVSCAKPSPPTETPETQKTTIPIVTVGDLVYKDCIERYMEYKKEVAEYKEIKYKEPSHDKLPPIQTGDIIKVLGKVESITIEGEFPDFSGWIELGPFYIKETITCFFNEKEEIEKIRNLQKGQWIIVQGKYKPDVGRNDKGRILYVILKVLDCRLLSVEPPVEERLAPEELKVGAMSAEELRDLAEEAYFQKAKEAQLPKGKIIKVFGEVDEVRIWWDYPESIQAEIIFKDPDYFAATVCYFVDEETIIRKLMKIPKGKEVIIQGTNQGYERFTVYGDVAVLDNCSLIYP